MLLILYDKRMNLTFACPSCDQTTRVELHPGLCELVCPKCSVHLDVDMAHANDEQLRRCPLCQSEKLFVRKDFPQRLGLTIVIAGFAASCLAWYYHQVILTFAFLFATAFIDIILFFLMGNLLECYRCHAHYREVDSIDDHGYFNLEVHEKYRQRQARLAPVGDTSNTSGSLETS